MTGGVLRAHRWSSGSRLVRRGDHWPPPARLAYPLLVLLALLPLLPALLLPYLPTVDGPAHVLDAFVIARYDDAGFEALRREYVLTSAPTPNLLTQVLLAALLLVTSPTGAEKAYAVILVCVFAVGACYCVRAVDRRSTWLAALAAPLATGYFFYFGFYNFCLGTGLFLIATGFFLRCRDAWTPRRTAVLLLALLTTAAAHLLPFGMAAIFITLTVLTDVVRTVRRSGEGRRAGPIWPALRRSALPPAAALVLPSCLSLLFLLRSDNVRGAGVHQYSNAVDEVARGASPFSLGQLLRSSFGQVVVYSRAEFALGMLLVGTVVVLVVLAARRRVRPAPQLLGSLAGMVLLCALLYASFPDALGTLAYISARFALFAWLFALLALATLPPSRAVGSAVLAVATVVAVGLPTARYVPQQRVTQDLQEYATAAEVVPAGSSFVTFRAWLDASPVLEYGYYDPTAHQSSRVAMAARALQLNHLDGRFDYFPAHFRDLDDLGARMTDLDEPRQWRQLLLEQAGEDDLDYVLVWGRERAGPALLERPGYASAQRLLDRAYRRVWVSEPQGLLEVYARR